MAYKPFTVEGARVKCEFPCPKCGKQVHGGFWEIPGIPKDGEGFTSPDLEETADCGCGHIYDVRIVVDGSGGMVSLETTKSTKRNSW